MAFLGRHAAAAAASAGLAGADDDVAVVSACLPVVSGSQRATATIETAAKAAQMALGSR